LFKFLAKAVLLDSASRSIQTTQTIVGLVECKKDTWDVLENTISVPLNESLLIIKDNPRLHIIKSTKNGTFYVSLGNCVKHDASDIVLREVAINLFMTGDLAFYSLVLGKENMSGKWCWHCNLSAKEWRDKSATGTLWTLDNMKEHLVRNSEGIPDRVKGITKEPLVTAIEPYDYVFNPLHSLDLGLNHIIKQFFYPFVDYLVEDVPEEEVALRIVAEKAAHEAEVAQEKCEQAKMELEAAEIECAATRLDLLYHSQSNMLAENESPEMVEVLLAAITQELKSRKEHWKLADKARKVAKKKENDAKNEFKKAEKRGVLWTRQYC
jgi:hypothetical protein